MPVEVILPKVDMDMTHGTLATWHVAPGETVAKGAPLFDIETDKAAMEVEAPASGRLGGVTAQPGDKVAVGTVVALIYADGEAEATEPTSPSATASASVSAGVDALEVILPKVDMDMSHGTLATWHVAEGQPVSKGAALFDIETDKAAMEVEAPASGILHHIMAQPGEKVPVGSVVAYIYPAGVAPGPRPTAKAAEVVAPTEPEAKALPAAPLATYAPSAATSAPVATSGAAPRATPAARAAARKGGIDLAQVTGTGPKGRIQRDDVANFVLPQAEAPHSPAVAATWSPQGGKLHVTTRKGTGTPLLMLHGFTADSQSWAPLEKAIGGDRPLIRIDLPGHGRSPRRRVADFAALARQLVEAFDDACGDHDRVDLLGHSLGGGLALALADIRPRRVRSLALISPAGLGPEIDAQALTGITRATRAESLAPWLRRLTATPDGISDDYAKAAMRLRADPELRAFQSDLTGVLFPDDVQPFDLRPALSRLECPTTLIWGRKDQILPWRHAVSVTGDFALHLLADAGHVPQIECPDRVARILRLHLAAAGGN
jgi:pyruvate/2-oxoglutarate dehydrogenase complex dihydrolipoamide acyltransferase (E2) component